MWLLQNPRQTQREMEERDDYKFLQIRDAVASLNQKVSLIGVILEISPPKQSKGTDCFCTLKIIDESHQKPGLSVNIFTENMENLPHISSVGDIIQLSHVVMKTLHREVNAVYNKKFSSFALYEGKDGKDFLPYQVSSRLRSRDQDKKFIASLRQWLVDFRLDEGSDNFLLLREIKEGQHVNMACKILHICEVAKDEWMAFVWDGTDTPPIQITTKLEDEMDNPLPLRLEPFSLSRDLLTTFPAVGTILRVIVDLGKVKHILHLLNTGKWVKFLKIHCEVHAGLWRGVLTPFTKLRYTPNEDCLTMGRQRLYEERLSLKWGRMPYFCFPWPSHVTEVDYGEAPFVTLMDVLTYSKVTAKFRCIVRVVSAIPWQAEDFRSHCGMYRLRLTLEDPTARIHAFVYAEDGENFFDGYPSIDVLTRKRNKLLGITVNEDGKEINDAPRNPPWVQCCLKSYYLVKSDAWGSRHYQIFGTKLVADSS